jgi:ABC-2 type transport system ATP-binding protein
MIEVNNLTKIYNVYDRREGVLGSVKDLFKPRYKKIEALKDVSFTINPGEIVGYIGTNGAGKSTTIKLLSGILTPSAGEVTVNNIIPSKERKKLSYNISVLFGQRTQLSWDIAVVESYKLLKNIYDVSNDEFEERLNWINSILDFKSLMYLPVRKLSLGQRMLCDIVASFIHNPKVIFLDEPTIGLDIFVKEQVHTLIKTVNQKYGTTFVITTHDINDIDKLCNRILIIDKGKLIFNGDKSHLNDIYGDECVVTFVSEEEFREEEVKKVMDSNATWKISDNKLTVYFNPNKINVKLIIEKAIYNFNSIVDMNIEKASLEHLIRKIYKK